MNDVLEKYVTDARALGTSDTDISNALVGAGWDREAVDKALLVQGVTNASQQVTDFVETSPILEVGKVKKSRRWGRVVLKGVGILAVLFLIAWFFPFPRPEAPTLDMDLVKKYTVVRDVTNAELGISISIQSGDVTEDYIRLVGQPAAPQIPSSFYERHLGQAEQDIVLNDVDKQDLMKIASGGVIQFKLPENVFDTPSTVYPSMSMMLQISRIVSRTAKEIADDGKYEEAENLLHLIILIGRNLQDGATSDITLAAGIAVEKEGTIALEKVLLVAGKTEQAAVAMRNLKDIEKQREGIKAIPSIRMGLTSAMLYQFTLGRIPAGVLPARIAYSLLDVSRQQILSDLVALQSIHDDRFFLEFSLPLAILAQTPVEPERTLAREVLSSYAVSSRTDVRRIAESALSGSPEQINQMLKEN